MEEAVGKIWHKWVSRWAYQGHREAAVELEEIKASLAIFFRAMGGDGGLKILAADKQAVHSRRSFLQRLAGSATHSELAWRDNDCLLLPAYLDGFPSRELNRCHYFWLAALASIDDSQLASEAGELDPQSHGFYRAQQRCLRVIEKYPGLHKRYQALVVCHIEQRPKPEDLKPREQAVELAVQQALLAPGSVKALPLSDTPPAPVSLWLRPETPQQMLSTLRPSEEAINEQQQPDKPGTIKRADQRRHKAEYQEQEEEAASLIAIRHETDIFSLSEMLKIARPPEEDEDSDNAAQMADDLDYLSISKDQKASSSRVRFDLDLPAAANGEVELEGAKLLPEWNYQKQNYRKNFCKIIPVVNTAAEAAELPPHLQQTARRLRRQFESLVNQSQWLRGQEDGPELDMEAVVADFCHRHLPQYDASPRLYQQLHRKHRDMASLVLADLSLSTEAGLDNEQQVVDVIRDSLFLFSECLQQIAEPFAIYGFSSRKREHVRFNTIKGFDDPYNAQIRGQLAAIKPGFYTRMGAAIRQATEILQTRPNKQKLLLIISDGKPNDLDQYDGRYGIEDSRKAIIEARQAGLLPYCITIDQSAEAYLPYLFGRNGFRLLQKAEQLPQALPELYSQLTGL